MLLGSSAGGAHFSSSTSDEKAVTTTTGTTATNTAAATSTSTSSTSSAGVSSSGGYVQGMTILCAPFLFVMPEVRHYSVTFINVTHTALGRSIRALSHVILWTYSALSVQRVHTPVHSVLYCLLHNML
jgi:hypothetical protein